MLSAHAHALLTVVTNTMQPHTQSNLETPPILEGWSFGMNTNTPSNGPRYKSAKNSAAFQIPEFQSQMLFNKTLKQSNQT